MTWNFGYCVEGQTHWKHWKTHWKRVSVHYNICSNFKCCHKIDKVQVFLRFVLNKFSTHVTSCSPDFTPFAECGKLLHQNIFILWNSVCQPQWVYYRHNTVKRWTGLRFVFLLGNPRSRLVHRIHSVTVSWIYARSLRSFVSRRSCHVPLYSCVRVEGSSRALVKSNVDISLSELNTFCELSSK